MNLIQSEILYRMNEIIRQTLMAIEGSLQVVEIRTARPNYAALDRDYDLQAGNAGSHLPYKRWK